MAEFGEENKVTGVFGGVEFGTENGFNEFKIDENGHEVGGDVNTYQNEYRIDDQEQQNAGTIRNEALPVKRGLWQRFKAFWLQEIDWNKEIRVELTPKQQKVEDEVNEFLHQEVTWEKIHNFLFQDITFGKKD